MSTQKKKGLFVKVSYIQFHSNSFTMPHFKGFPGGSVGKESACNEGDPDLIPGSGRSPGEGNGNPLQYSCLENPHGPRNLAGYSLECHKRRT